MQEDDPTSPDDDPTSPPDGFVTPQEAGFGFWDDLGFDEGADATAREARPWRMAGLAAGTCLVAIAVAVILLQFSGGSSNKDVSLPIITGGPSSPALISSPGPVTTAITRAVHPIRRPSTSARPTRTRTSASTSATPTPSRTATTAHTSRPPSTTPAPPSTSHTPLPSVRLSKGGRDFRCGAQCYFLDVTLSNLGGGHHIVCEAKPRHAQTGTAFASYDTADSVSFGCSYAGRHDSVWVVVDDLYQSNVITDW